MPGIAEMKHMVSQGKHPSTGHLEGAVKYLTHRRHPLVLVIAILCFQAKQLN